MPLFNCTSCCAIENTALCNYWLALSRRDQSAPFNPLCSKCDPDIREWHGRFPRTYEPVSDESLAPNAPRLLNAMRTDPERDGDGVGGHERSDHHPHETGQGEPVAWAYEVRRIGGLTWSPAVLLQKPPVSGSIRNIRPLFAAPAPSRPVDREEIAEVVWQWRYGKLHNAAWAVAKHSAQSIPDGKSARCVNEIYACADAIRALPLPADLNDGVGK